ncbi:MAG: RluA family pseudouridine synthase [Clostridia bacterium]|nr:RluA family pseudouridine synthase [Clostridia bacterium]
MELVIDEGRAGKSVYDILRRELGVSNRMLTRLKQDERGILVDGDRVTVRYRLSAGQCLTLAVDDRERAEHILPVELPLDILCDDPDFFAVNKPPNMPTHPSHGHYDDTLANALAYHCAAAGEPFVFRPVNRLDRNTSGIVLVARSQLAAARLSASMQAGEIEKRYLALLDGVLTPDEGELCAPIRRTAESIITREVCAEGEGDYALTRWRVLARGAAHTLVETSPVTGRTHQLRVHFAHLGCPIHGDDLYGTAADDLERQALHAVSLDFPHPADRRPVRLTAPAPDDLRACITAHFGKDILS